MLLVHQSTKCNRIHRLSHNIQWGRATIHLLYMQPTLKRLFMQSTQLDICVTRHLHAIGWIKHHVLPSRLAYQ
jgi:hypothetical protein